MHPWFYLEVISLLPKLRLDFINNVWIITLEHIPLKTFRGVCVQRYINLTAEREREREESITLCGPQVATNYYPVRFESETLFFFLRYRLHDGNSPSIA